MVHKVPTKQLKEFSEKIEASLMTGNTACHEVEV